MPAKQSHTSSLSVSSWFRAVLQQLTECRMHAAALVRRDGPLERRVDPPAMEARQPPMEDITNMAAALCPPMWQQACQLPRERRLNYE